MTNNPIKKWLPAIAVFWVCVSIAPQYAACSEKYYIDNNKVLLYKIINWWYDSLPEESQQLCGSIVRCRTKGNIQVQYLAGGMTLRLAAKDSFADLLSVFKQCGQCRGPSYLKSTWVNKDFFGNGKFIPPTGKYPSLTTYTFTHVDRARTRRLKSIAADIGLELEGVICGLMNGKIALHHSGNLLKTCPAGPDKQDEMLPITLKIVNSRTEEILAKFSAGFDDKNHNRCKSDPSSPQHCDSVQSFKK